MTRAPHTDRGRSQRQLRVGEMIRRTLAELLAQGDLHDPDLDGASITVGEVRASPDLKHATAYVLPLGGQNADVVLAALRRQRPAIRHRLAKSVELRAVPDLHFEIDETFDRLDATRRMFSDPAVRRDVEGEEA